MLTVSDDSSCVASITVTITEPPALQLTESHVDIICNGDTSGSIDLTVTGGVPPYQYNWSSSQTTEDIQNIGAGVYTVTVTDDSSCQETLSITVVEPPPIPVTNDQKRICVGDSIFLGGAYQHDPGVYFDTLPSVNNCDSVIRTTLVVDSVLYDTIRVSICDNSTYNFGGDSYNQTGNYYDTLVSTGGCDSIVRLELTVNRTYRDTLQVSICNGESYYAGGANQTTPGYYTDNLTTIFGCDSIVVTHLTVLPTYSFTRDTTICQGQAIFVGGGLQTTPGIYRDTFPTIHGCDSVITTNLDVSVVQIDGYNETICAGTTTTLTPGSGYTSYQWSPGGENTAYITAGPGTYTVVVSNPYGCVDSANYTVLQAPDINLEAVPDSVAIEPGQPVTIALNTNNAASIQSFYWDPEEGLFCPDVANCDEIIVAPEEDTYYMIVATDVWGCKDTTYIIVNVIDLGDVLLYVPNSFSPNGDGNNDEFRVYGRGFKRYRLMIFDRWGEKVFESYDPDEGWDGTFKGEPLNPGVYVYYLDIDFIKNLQPPNYLRDRKGSVTLIK
ncbi:MAG: hypothetical protein D6706_14815 [Chloroflexi bacterium]|nr:MAG: hypothetical protein D6706_14815 [Chloroflexota bacterium]